MMSELQFKRSVWVSYSGADKQIVHQLTKQVNGNGELIQMLTYLRDSDDKPSRQSELSENHEFNQNIELQAKETLTTYLKPWESIGDLIQTIGSNLRRMIFLSNNYIQSEYCMRELMCILTRSPHSPLLFVLVDVDSFNVVCQSRNYAFLQENEESEIPNLTLAQALAKVYLRLKADKKMTPEFELPDDEDEINLVRFFTNRLTTIGDKLRTRVDCNIEDKEGYICKATLSENCNQLQQFLSVYVKNFSVETITERYKEAKKDIINSWLDKTTLGIMCKEELDAEQVFIRLSSRDIEQVENLCDVIREKSEKLNLDKTKIFEQAQPIISLMLTSIISEEWAAEIHFNSIISSPTRLSVTNKDPESLFLLSIGLAAANMHQLTVSPITKDTQTPKVDQVFDLLPNALEENSVLQNPIIEDILQLVSGFSKDEIVSMLKNDQPYQIRNRINRYQRKFASKMQECSLPPIVLRASHVDFHQLSQDIPRNFSQVLTHINSNMIDDPNDKKIHFGLLIVKNDDNDNVVLNGGDSTADAILLAVKSMIVELTK